MYLTRVIDEARSRDGKKRVILEESVSEKCYRVKAVFKFPDEEAARRRFDELYKRRPKDNKLEAPAPASGNGKSKKEDK